jgi:hypothetical protein
MDSSTEGLIKLKDAARDTQKIEPSEIQNPLTRKAFEKWDRLRGTRRFPSRTDAAPRELSLLLRNIALVRVIQGGAEFEFRIVGDALVQAQPGLRAGLTTPQLDEEVPGYGTALRLIYQDVCDSRRPEAYRGFYQRSADKISFYHETLLLPLGTSDGVVDHILVVGVYATAPNATLA